MFCWRGAGLSLPALSVYLPHCLFPFFLVLLGQDIDRAQKPFGPVSFLLKAAQPLGSDDRGHRSTPALYYEPVAAISHSLDNLVEPLFRLANAQCFRYSPLLPCSASIVMAR